MPQWLRRGILALPFTGMIAGMVGGLTGIGGGVLLVPILTRFFKVDQHKAHGTSLAVVFFIALFSVLRGFPSWQHCLISTVKSRSVETVN